MVNSRRTAITTGDDRPPAAPPNLHLTDRGLKNLTDWFGIMRIQNENADLKVQAIFAINSLLLGALVFSRIFSGEIDLSRLTQTVNGTLSLLAIAVLIVGVAWSTLCVMLTIYPRARISRHESLYAFSEHEMDESSFVSATMGLDNAGTAYELLTLIHLDARNSVVKFRWANRATFGLSLALIAWLVQFIIGLI